MMFEEVRNNRFSSRKDSPEGSQEKTGVLMREELYSELVEICLNALPQKAYGLVGGGDLYHPGSLYPCTTNLRNTPEWKPVFESFGEFHKNPDVGFVITPSEVKAVMDKMALRGEHLIGVFHSHRYLCAEPSIADIGLNSGSEIFSYIVSVVNPPSVEVGIFSLRESGYRSIPIVRI
jgi:proteasome lid subunit RPN8/RPN11